MEFGGQHQIVPMHHFLDPGAAKHLGRGSALHPADPGQLGRREVALPARELGPVAIGQHDERPGFKDPFHLLDPGREQALPFGQHRFRSTCIYHHRTFFSRLHHFVRLSSAFVVVPGGIGTTLETMMIWQLCQVRHVPHLPLIFVGEMWKELVDWGREHMVKAERALASSEDMDIPRCVNTVEEAIEIIREDLERFRAA